MPESMSQYPPLPPDDLQRNLTVAQPDTDQKLPHIGLVGDTYTSPYPAMTPMAASV